MNKRRILSGLWAAVVLVLVGCATQNTPYDNVILSWRGATADQLYQTWGYPNRIMKRNNGHRILVYDYTQQDTVKGKHGAPAQVIQANCLTWFEVNASNHIVSAQSKGDECVVNDDFIKAYTRSSNVAALPKPSAKASVKKSKAILT